MRVVDGLVFRAEADQAAGVELSEPGRRAAATTMVPREGRAIAREDQLIVRARGACAQQQRCQTECDGCTTRAGCAVHAHGRLNSAVTAVPSCWAAATCAAGTKARTYSRSSSPGKGTAEQVSCYTSCITVTCILRRPRR